MKKFPVKPFTRLKQLFCKHKHFGKIAFNEGVNSKEGLRYVAYTCINCDLCMTVWEKKEDF